MSSVSFKMEWTKGATHLEIQIFLVFSIHLTNTTEAEKSRTMIPWLQLKLKAFKPSLGLCGFVLHNLCVHHTCGFGKCPYCELAIRERERETMRDNTGLVSSGSIEKPLQETLCPLVVIRANFSSLVSFFYTTCGEAGLCHINSAHTQ